MIVSRTALDSDKSHSGVILWKSFIMIVGMISLDCDNSHSGMFLWHRSAVVGYNVLFDIGKWLSPSVMLYGILTISVSQTSWVGNVSRLALVQASWSTGRLTLKNYVLRSLYLRHSLPLSVCLPVCLYLSSLPPSISLSLLSRCLQTV